jgi:hypothetical protein
MEGEHEHYGVALDGCGVQYTTRSRRERCMRAGTSQRSTQHASLAYTHGAFQAHWLMPLVSRTESGTGFLSVAQAALPLLRPRLYNLS